MSQLFIAKELYSLLQLWEDMNLIGDFNFHLDLMVGTVKKGKGVDSIEKTRALIGSEMNLLGSLARAIPDYAMLRSVLGGRSYLHQTNFLPRIPKGLRGLSYDSNDDFYNLPLVDAQLRIPMYLLKWTETRRACIVEDSLPIPLLDLRQESWFTHLPYHSFYLSIRSPFVLTLPDDKELTVKDFLVYDDHDSVRILLWATQNEQHQFTPEERTMLTKALADVKKQKTNSKIEECIAANRKLDGTLIWDFFIEKESGKVYQSHIDGKQVKRQYFDIYNPINYVKDEDSSHYRKIIGMVEMLNGFCKLTAEMRPIATVVSTGQQQLSNSVQHNRQWYELPLQTVDYFAIQNEGTAVVLIRNANGSEKSPHVRRGHYRRYVNKDGTQYKVWIDETIIREDKLNSEQLQGGALKIQ